jgi:flagellar biosynthetic protein FliP
MNALRTARCYVEMVAGMIIGMVVLEPLWPAVTTASTTPVGWQAMVMATDMSIGMSAVMLLRRHHLHSTLRMCAAMYAPFVVLLAPYSAGWLSADVYFNTGHLLMLLLMLGLTRRTSTPRHAVVAHPSVATGPPSASIPARAPHPAAPITDGSSS